MNKNKLQIFIDKLRGKIPSIKEVKKSNEIKIPQKYLKHCVLDIRGVNNVVKTDDNAKIAGSLFIKIYGDNNRIEIKENASINLELTIRIGQNHSNYGKACNTVFEVGKSTTIGSVEYRTLNSNARCIIGENCLFSTGITIYNTDAHPVYDIFTNEIINKVREIRIGNHCCIGLNATILKNTQIADDSICGLGSVLSGKYEKPHCAIAGNPAKVVKENVTWSRDAGAPYVSNVL